MSATNTLNLSGSDVHLRASFQHSQTAHYWGQGSFLSLGATRRRSTPNIPALLLNGLYTGKLNNGGDTITLVPDQRGRQVFSVAYNNNAPWPVTPHGFGYSLVQKDPGVSPAPDKARKWRASTHPGGSPGADDPAPTIPGIVVNEVLANSPAPLVGHHRTLQSDGERRGHQRLVHHR